MRYRLIACVAALVYAFVSRSAEPLTTLEYRVRGTGLQVTPAAVAVPKGIAGSVFVTLTGGEAVQALAEGAYVEAFLRGPGLPEPRRIIAPVNQPLIFPPFNLVGDYQLDTIRLVDAVTGAVRMEGTPNIVPVRVFDEVLISRVTSRPLTLDEIQDRGVFIDEQNFRAIEFEVGFVLDGQTIPIKFPVVAPRFTQSTEIIPAAELEEKLAEAAALNQQISSVVQLPPEFETARLNIQVQGINFQRVDEGEGDDLALQVPPIPALMVIPGNIGFLNQFFSVMIFTENGAPSGSGLSVHNILAELKLPPGPDQIPATDYNQPGDDPLRFARIGPDRIIQPIQQIKRPGPDGQLGTGDDIARLYPGESGQAEFLVEGLQEGLHVMNLDLTADLDGLAAGTVRVKGKAAGSVLVRNPRFSMAFSHPRTVRAGEPYQASVTVLNTGGTPANLVQVTLNKNSISGARLEDENQQTIPLGTLLPGQTATATFRLVALRTGAISFSNLTTSDDSTVGRFRLSMGVDERGVALSPDTLAMPDFVDELPPEVVFAATRVLGQALSVATAGQLPPGVQRVSKSIITRRVLELAEAGQRLRYGDLLGRVLADLLRDWQGGREANNGFDQILRETDAGFEWRTALFVALESADNLTATERVTDRAADYAGLGQRFALAAGNTGELRAEFDHDNLLIQVIQKVATADRSDEPYALVYPGGNGSWAVTPARTNTTFVWAFPNGPPSADISVVLVGDNGQARQLSWTIVNPPPDAVYRYSLFDSAIEPFTGSTNLLVDLNGDGVTDSTIQPFSNLTFNEIPPTLIAVEQDLTVNAGRPRAPCVGPEWQNYGTVVAVVFSKPVSQATAGNPAFYTLDGNNGANSVSVQPGGRVAYLNLRKGISAIRSRTLTLDGVTDVRGNPLAGGQRAVRSVYPGTEVPFTGGVAIRGRVIKGDGSPAIGIPVTLTMYDQAATGFECVAWIRRVSQVFTDEGGGFDFDFVMAGIPYSISATDTSGLSEGALALIMESTVQGELDRSRLESLINSATTQNTLLAAFAAGSLPQAIAKAEGLDRALVRDIVLVGSSREGQEVPIALRFRGRATVTGRVVAADGVTPLPAAAVNLFPDPDSRELGRGLFADGDGRFAFFGVPLGVFTVDVKTSDGRARTVAGLLDTPGQIADIVIALPSEVVPLATLRGRVFEADNLTAHGNARIFIGRYDPSRNNVADVVRIVDADGDGNWEAAGIPARALDVVAVTFDGRRKGVRRGITPLANAITFVNVSLEDITRVFGRVQFDDGRPAPNALVSGGEALVRADANGNFELQGVPVGRRTFSAGLERNPEANIHFPRLGSVTADIVGGAENFVVIRLRPAGRIFGRVFDANGQPQGGVNVAIPQEGGFFWTTTDGGGNYAFENLGLDQYTLSAPAPATAETDTKPLVDAIASGQQDQILAAFEEALQIFVGARDPFLTGDQQNFRPSTWGYIENVRIRFDGENVLANIRYLAQGTVSGRVLNHQAVPIGARVRLTGIGPSPTGRPQFTIRGERDSDPALGTFTFPNQLLAGPWGVQAATPFYPVVIQQSGFTTEIDVNVTNIVLQFPSAREVNGRIAGRVLFPDGGPAGDGVRVKISISADYEILTDTNGVFDTQIAVPALGADGRAIGYNIEAFDPASGLRGNASVSMTPGITNMVDVRLLSRSSAVEITVLRGNGLPATGAQVELAQGSFPREAPLTAFADAAGRARFENLWEGSYAVSAQFTEGATRVFARGGVSVGPDQERQVTLHLGATGTIAGRFVKLDGITPIEAAQVRVGNLGFATTDADGNFHFEGVPIGTHRLVSSDPITGAFASANVMLSVGGEVRTVLLIEIARGEVAGFVVDSYGETFVSGATVTIRFDDGLTAERTVTTGPDGQFSFPGSPAGGFRLEAQHPTLRVAGSLVRGTRTGHLPETATSVSADIELQPLGLLHVTVVRDDGTTPAQNTRVRIRRQLGSAAIQQEKDTDAGGQVLFNDLPLLNGYTLRAISNTGGELRNGVQITNDITARGTNSPIQLALPGIGRVEGTVVGSDGATPVNNAEVIIRFNAPAFAGETELAITGPDGRFVFDDVPVGDYRLTAASVSLAASFNGDISANGEVDEVTLRLGDSGEIRGQLVRADGTTPAGNVEVLVTYASQSANPGRAFVRSEEDGAFAFSNIPVGTFSLEAVAPAFGGIIKRTAALAFNGQILDLGELRFDEDFPAVLAVTPEDTAIEVPITTAVELLFSEALATNSIRTNGIFIRGVAGTVASNVELLETNGVNRLVRIQPLAPLQSEKTYEVIVLAGDLLNAVGSVIGSGPRDLVDRPLAAPFISRFTTADNDPPVLLSLFPSNNAVQIDTRAVPRLSFNETIRPDGFVFRLDGPDGLVTGPAAVGVDGRVLSFVPAAFLKPNATYTLSVSNVFDLAGNRAAGEPFIATFHTLDTIGPNIASLQIADGRMPIAGTTIPVEATLAGQEPGASVRFTQNFNPIGVSTNGPFRANVTLPLSGTNTIRAIATDQYGNDGPLAELVITVLPNALPQIQFVRILPASGPLPSGSFFVVDVRATDDSAVASLRAIATGTVQAELNATNSTQLRVQGTVPASAGAGSFVRIFAEAIDDSGQSSGEQSLELAVSDNTPPTVAILSPAANTQLLPGESYPVQLQAADNFGVTNITLNVSGAFTTTVSRAISPAATNASEAVSLQVPPGVIPNGASVLLQATARDGAGLTSASASLLLRMADFTPPELVSLVPADGATGVDVRPIIEAIFSEPLDSNTVNSATVTLTHTVSQTNVPLSLSLHTNLARISATPVNALIIDASYRLLISSNITDLAGNRLAADIESTFETGDFRFVRPLAGTSVIEGQTVTLEAASDTLLVSAVRFSAQGVELAVDAAPPFRFDYTIPTLAILGGSEIQLLAEALDAASNALASAQSSVLVLSADADTDGDGIPNGEELRIGTDPFLADAHLDPDLDGLTNFQEWQIGTDPFNPDTSGDGIPDGIAVNPLVANSPPSAGAMQTRAALQFDGINDSVVVPTRTVIAASGTIEIGFTPLSVEGFQHLVFAGDGTGDGFGGQNEFHINLSGNRLQFYCHSGGSVLWSIEGEPRAGALEAGRAYRAAATWDSAAGRVALFIDGNRVAEGAFTGTPSFGNWQNTVRFGRHHGAGAPERAFHGVLEEARFWNYARPQNEIRRDLHRTLTGLESGLAGYWRMDEGAGDMAFDHTDRIFDAALGGGTTASMPVWTNSPLGIRTDLRISVNAGALFTVTLAGGDADNDLLTARIISLPVRGKLFQTADGVSKGAEITATSTNVTDAQRRVIYEPDTGLAGLDSFVYVLNDGQEDSGQAAAQIHVVPANTPPVAVNDTRAGFEDTPLVISNLLANDADADGDTLRILSFGQPANGTLADNGDGTFTYTPNPGFNGTDSFSYTVGDAVAWKRSLDFTPGTSHRSTSGNPDDDGFGFKVWQMDYVRGGALNSVQPWFVGRGAKMVWDNSWFGGSGLWARDDDVSPPISASTSTHVISSAAAWEDIPLVRWICPVDDFEADILGELIVHWSGNGNVGSPVDVDIVIALRKPGEEAVTTLYTNTLAKPTPGDSIGDQIRIPVNLPGLLLNRGDEILVSHRARNVVANRWINLADRIVLVPSSPGHTAIVTINIGANNTPVANAPAKTSALLFDGSDDYVHVGNPPELQITGNQTIEFWIKPANFDARRNPIAKAYAGEGTMTIELSGHINYFWGILGNNSGTGGVDYQGFGTGAPLQLQQWTHVALVRDLDAGKLYWYINGRKSNEVDAQFPSAVAGTLAFYIGRGYVSNVAGEMDEVRIWNVARTAAQIEAGVFARMNGNEPGLVAYWNFDEGAGNTAGDRTANTLNGALGGGSAAAFPLWVNSFVPYDNAITTLEDNDLVLTLDGTDADGDSLTSWITQLPGRGVLYQIADGSTRGSPVSEAGSALRFDGNDDVVVLPHEVLDGRSDVTVEFWLRTSKTGGQSIVSGANTGNDNEYLLWLQNDREFRLYTGNNSSSQVSWSIPSIADDRWHHFAVVRNQTAGHAELFLDGMSQGTRAAAMTTLEITPGGLVLGQEQDSVGGGFVPAESFQGTLDEVRIWEGVHTAEAIRTNMHILVSAGAPGLIAYWRMNEGAGTVLADATVNGFDGVLGGGVAARAPERIQSTAPVFPMFPVLITHPDHRVIYAPDADFNGLDFLTFFVNDGKVDSAEAMVPIRVIPVNDAPVANDDLVLALEGLPVRTGNVLANDTDVDGDVLAIFDFTQPANGSVISHGDGTFTYTSNPGFSGNDAFTYRATDGQTNSNPATVNIIVSPLDQFRWINTNGGNWNVAANWSQGVVPGPDDDAVIDLSGDYTVTLDVDATVNRLILGGTSGNQTLSNNGRRLTVNTLARVGTQGTLNFLNGTIDGAGLIQADGTFHWLGGTMGGTGVTEIGTNGVLNLGSGATKSLNRTLNIAGVADWTGGQINFGNSTLNNAGVFLANVANTLAWNGGNPVFNNSGLFVKTNAGTITFSIVVFHNSGSIQFTNGTMALNGGGSHSSEWQIPNGALLSINSNVEFLAGSRLFGDGNVSFIGGTTTFSGAYEIVGLTSISGGTVNFNSDVTMPTLNLSSTLAGSGAVTVTSQMNWTAGTLGGSGVATISPGAVLNLSSGATKSLNRTMNNFGVADWSAGQINLGNGTLNNAGVFLAPVAGVLAWNGGNPAFHNSGTLIKTNSGTLTFSSVAFNNSGVVELGDGAMSFNTSGVHGGIYNFAANTALNFTSGTHTYASGLALNGAGVLNWSGATIHLSADQTITQTIQFSGGALSGTNSLTVDGVLNWTSGTMNAGAVTEINATGVLNLASTGTKALNRTLNNSGTVDWTGGQINFGSSTLNNSGVFLANIPGTLAWNGGNPAFNNTGLFVKTNAGTVNFNSVVFNNSGVVELGDGAMSFNTGGIHSGTYNLAANTALNFTSGTHTYAAGLTLNGAGVLNWSGATIQLSSDQEIAQTIQFSSGTLSGTNTLSVQGVLNWTGGTMSAGAVTEISTNAVLNLSGATTKSLNRTLNNFGTVDWTGGQINFASSVLNNTGVFLANTAGTFAWNGGSPAFNNSGLFVKTNTGTVAFNSVAFNNSGALELGDGTVTLNVSSTQNGSFNLGDGALFNFTSGTHTFNAGSTFAGSGTLRFQSPIVLTAPLNFNTLAIVFQSAATVSGNFLISNAPGGTITVNKTMTFPGSMTIAGTLRVGGASFTVTIGGTLTLESSGTIDNPGIIRAGAFVNNGGTIIGNPPEVIGGVPLLLIYDIQTSLADEGNTVQAAAAPSASNVRLRWSGPPGHRFILESSSNLLEWTESPASMTESTPGDYEAIAPRAPGPQWYFRIRLLEEVAEPGA